MEKLWRQTFYDELGVSPETQPVILTDAPLTPESDREKMIQTMFETFNVPAFYVASRAVTAMYSTGRSTGVVVQSREGVTTVTPINEQYTVKAATARSTVAGSNVTDSLMELLGESGTNVEAAVAHDIKATCCYVALDYDKELAAADSSLEKSYDLPNGQTITIGNERFRAPEVLFQPGLLSLKSSEIDSLVQGSISVCDVDVRKDLYGYIVLVGRAYMGNEPSANLAKPQFQCGGNTLFPDMGARLQGALKAQAPPGTKIRVRADEQRDCAAWRGGSILGSSSAFRTMCISRSEYDEQGA